MRKGEDLAEAVARLTGRLAELEQRCGASCGWDEPKAPLSDRQLAAIAEAVQRSRRRRALYLDPALLGEPAWDMLLDLFVAAVRREEVTVTSLCQSAAVPVTTALRWIAVLEDQALVERRPVPGDPLAALAVLTEAGREAVRSSLAEWSWADPGPA